MKLINGKFYKDKKEVPLEISNVEQIRLLKECGAITDIKEESEENYTTDIEVEFEEKKVVDYGIIKFECLCGNMIEEYSDEEYNDDDEDENEVLSDFNNSEIECDCCGRLYSINARNREAILIKNV